MANPCLQPNQSDFRGYPHIEYTQTKSQSFNRNNCPSGQSGSSVVYSKTYTSYISEADLMLKIRSDESNFNAEGQANANSQGSCSTSCIVNNSTLTAYETMALSSTQIWLKDSNNRIRQPLSKSTVLSGGSYSEGPLLRNTGIFGWTGWKSPYPYTNNTTAYMLTPMEGNAYGMMLRTVNLSTGNACSAIPSGTLIFTAKSPGGWALQDALFLSNGILFLIGYNYSGGIKNLDVVWHPFGGTSTIIESIQRPHNYKYYARSSRIAYNGSTAFIMASFASKNNSKRTRTAIFQVNFVGGTPSSVTQTVPFDYSNQGLKVITGCHAGTKLFFIYMEDGGFRVYPILGGSVPTPPSDGTNYPYQFVWDAFNPEVCYLGMYGRLIRYSSITNTWTTLR